MTDGNGHRDPAGDLEILREVSAVQQETARRIQETDRQMQETDRRMQETRQLLGGRHGPPTGAWTSWTTGSTASGAS